MKYREPEIVIPELEEMAKNHVAHYWSEKHDKILTTYYNKVPIRSLAKHCGGRSVQACQQRAYVLGLTGARKDG